MGNHSSSSSPGSSLASAPKQAQTQEVLSKTAAEETANPSATTYASWTRAWIVHEPGSTSIETAKVFLQDILAGHIVRFGVAGGPVEPVERYAPKPSEGIQPTDMDHLLKLLNTPPHQRIQLVDGIASLDIAVAAAVLAEMLFAQLGAAIEDGKTRGVIARSSLPFGIIAVQQLQGQALATALDKMSPEESSIVYGWTVVATTLTPTHKVKLAFHPKIETTRLHNRHWQVFVDPTNPSLSKSFAVEDRLKGTQESSVVDFEEQSRCLARLIKAIAASLHLLNEVAAYMRSPLRPSAGDEQAQQAAFEDATVNALGTAKEEKSLMGSLRAVCFSQYLRGRSGGMDSVGGMAADDRDLNVTNERQDISHATTSSPPRATSEDDNSSTVTSDPASNSQDLSSPVTSTPSNMVGHTQKQRAKKKKAKGKKKRAAKKQQAQDATSISTGSDQVPIYTPGESGDEESGTEAIESLDALSLNPTSQAATSQAEEEQVESSESQQAAASPAGEEQVESPESQQAAASQTEEEQVESPKSQQAPADSSSPTATSTSTFTTSEVTAPPTQSASLSTITEEDEDETTTTKANAKATQATASAHEEALAGEQTPTPSSARLAGPSSAATASTSSAPSTTVFSFDNYHPETRCRNPDCRKSTHPLDGSTKICPACGPRSMVRYCSRVCLYKDVRRHFFGECGQLSIQGPIDLTTLNAANNNVRPYLRPAFPALVNTIERHRQAVWFAMESEGEYWIFDDVEECGDLLNTREPTKEEYQEVRGLGNCVTAVFPPAANVDQFRSALITAMSYGPNNVENRAYCEALVGMIIRMLQAHGDWDMQMCNYLCTQVGFEIGYQVSPDWQIWR